jgi:hypothetical protein
MASSSTTKTGRTCLALYRLPFHTPLKGTSRVADHRPSRSGFQGASRMALATSSGVAPRLRRSRAWAVKRMGFSTPLA